MKNYLAWHQLHYPLMEKQDIVKLLYQSVFAGGHMIENPTRALQHLFNEITQLNPNPYEYMYDVISLDYVRINLHPFISYHLSLCELHKAFVQSANDNQGDIKHYQELLKTFSIDESMTAQPHHSDAYRNHYHPHYRVIHKKHITPIYQYAQAHRFLSNINQFSIVALEGKCTSGKSTLANKLQATLPITIIPIDDFFLPPNLKTKNRLNEVGGNIDYERVKTTLENLKPNQVCTYEAFDCQTNTYFQKSICVKKIVLLEGVYSYHPFFSHLIDYLMFLEISDSVQFKRLEKRFNFKQFLDIWKPLEDVYYDKNAILAKSNIII